LVLSDTHEITQSGADVVDEVVVRGPQLCPHGHTVPPRQRPALDLIAAEVPQSEPRAGVVLPRRRSHCDSSPLRERGFQNLGEGAVAKRDEGLDGLADAVGGVDDGLIDLINDVSGKHLMWSLRLRRRRYDLNQGRAWLRPASPWAPPGISQDGAAPNRYGSALAPRHHQAPVPTPPCCPDPPAATFTSSHIAREKGSR
jgi:hypothetical protein